MNRIKLLTFIASCAMIVTSCENGDNNNLPNNPTKDNGYTGVMHVDQNDGTIYTQEDVVVDYELHDDSKLNFVMYKVKFATGMPLKLDMVVEGVDYTGADGECMLTGDGIVPYAMGGPFEKFTITELEGCITDSSMTLSFMCGEHAVTYSGTK